MSLDVAHGARTAAHHHRVRHRALAVDADADPDRRLANLVAQRRARWLLHHIDELFLPAAKES